MLPVLTPETFAELLPTLPMPVPWPPAVRGWALVVDADRTLAPVDTGRQVGEVFTVNQSIRATFEALGYVAEAFRRVSEIWSEVPADRYLAEIERVADETAIYPGWLELLAACTPQIPVLVASAGIPQVWRRILARHGFPRVPVIGGCHPALDRYVVCPLVKEALVRWLQARGLRVVVAGDSAIDEPMLRASDLPLLVADHRGSPALRHRLAGDPRVRHLKLDERTFVGLASIEPGALRALLTTDTQEPRIGC